MKRSRILVASVVLAATATLAACGGNDHEQADAGAQANLTGPGDAPESASESISAFFDYLMQVVGLQTETDEPVGVNNVNPPTSETDEPSAVS